MMKKDMRRKRVFRSMREFEKQFLPKTLKKKLAEKPKDAQALGVSLAKESLEKVSGQLAKPNVE
jgi:hypothetical protein